MSTMRGAHAVFGVILLSVFTLAVASASAPRVILIDDFDDTS